MGGLLKLKTALGISSCSLVHHWDKAGAPGQIPGYSNHVNAISRAAKYMQNGGYLGIDIGGGSLLLAIQEVCVGDSGAACKKVKFTEGGKFVSSIGLGYLGGELAHVASPTICAALGVTTAIGGVVCAATIVGVGAWEGTTVGGEKGEAYGETLYRAIRP